MSYQVLARKWRPANFTEVAGQGHVLKSLINALDNERLHHAYLFTGTRGVGKTTLARILAKCLNCETGITSKPCESCAACHEINEGRFIDLIEVDAASRTKVEDTRDLLENVQYSPSRGRFKVYLIDEVHMLSNHSFNALLKTLEEPPSHVKFLFATTDPQKLPVTILSRCLQFNLKNLSPQLIVEYLQKVLQEEDIAHEADALWQIASAAAGSMRDALTLVDQAISYCQGQIVHAGVIEMLGVPEQAQVFELLSAMARGDLARVLELVNAISDRTPDYAHTLDSLLSTLHRIALAQAAENAVDNSFGDRQQVLQLASVFAAEDIQLFYQIGVKGRGELRLGVDMRSAFEMLLLRMMVFSPSLVNQDLLPTQSEQENAAAAPNEQSSEYSTAAKSDAAATGEAHAAEHGPALKKKTLAQEAEANSDARPSQQKPPALESQSPSEQEPVPSREPRPEPSPNLSDEPPLSISTEPTPEEAVQRSETNQTSAAETKHACAAKPSLGTLDHAQWLQIFTSLPVSGIAANVLANTQCMGAEGASLNLLLAEDQSAVFNADLVPKLSHALSQYFDETVDVVINIGEVSEETPAARAQRLKQEGIQNMINEFETDTNVQQLVDRFSASIEKSSITPVKS